MGELPVESISGPAATPEQDVELVAFDVDGTLVEHQGGLVIWQVLNRRWGPGGMVDGQRWRDFQEGRLSYADWVRLDVEGWRDGGATREEVLATIRRELRLVDGAERVVHGLVARGYVVCVVSGTLDIVLETLFPDHPFSHVFCNRISFDAAGLISGWQATPYDMEGKAAALHQIASRTGIPVGRFAFVGDHLNDCSALSVVGCPVAYDPKHERTRSLARHVLAPGRLDGLLDLLPGPRPARR
jgi:HAD superfamily phosphoserine phosphatase-like hydrolase